ncbi:MAG: hypothetical protein R2882_13225 [Gemmatimonadales bacterium]
MLGGAAGAAMYLLERQPRAAPFGVVPGALAGLVLLLLVSRWE